MHFESADNELALFAFEMHDVYEVVLHIPIHKLDNSESILHDGCEEE
jgi:hypothetical protein